MARCPQCRYRHTLEPARSSARSTTHSINLDFVFMPIYAFECAACGHEFDRLQKLSDADPTDCPVCAKPQLKRQLTAPQFRLAGTGWYETDFKKDGEKKRNLVGGDGAGKPSESKSDAAAASKPAEAKSEPKPAA
jgi:putative FmdB family regulatory protein